MTTVTELLASMIVDAKACHESNACRHEEVMYYERR